MVHLEFRQQKTKRKKMKGKKTLFDEKGLRGNWNIGTVGDFERAKRAAGRA